MQDVYPRCLAVSLNSGLLLVCVFITTVLFRALDCWKLPCDLPRYFGGGCYGSRKDALQDMVKLCIGPISCYTRVVCTDTPLLTSIILVSCLSSIIQVSLASNSLCSSCIHLPVCHVHGSGPYCLAAEACSRKPLCTLCTLCKPFCSLAPERTT